MSVPQHYGKMPRQLGVDNARMKAVDGDLGAPGCQPSAQLSCGHHHKLLTASIGDQAHHHAGVVEQYVDCRKTAELFSGAAHRRQTGQVEVDVGQLTC
ncbi:hypothetical protein TYRP_020714 [Tyrophagus putrescentiae]|nr:hypothetical protein TYRP_020714 [Tyrophagus putrescentiae]